MKIVLLRKHLPLLPNRDWLFSKPEKKNSDSERLLRSLKTISACKKAA